MKKITDRIKIKQHHVPWILLGTTVLAYGILINRLGFYWDDWPTLFLSSATDDPSLNHLFPFRPLHVYLDMWTVNILGYTPIYWHILMLLIRYLGGLFLWLFLNELWPKKQLRNAWTAILFLVYPSFLHQSMSVIYRQHFTTALLYLISMYLMVKAFNAWENSRTVEGWISTLFSLAFGISHLFIMEYFSAMELLRPLVILMLVLREKPKAGKAIRKLATFWIPYFAYLAGFVIWRTQYASSELGDRTQLVLLDQFTSAPYNTLVTLFQTILLDLRNILIGSWMGIFRPDLVDISSPFSLGVLAMIALSGVGLYFLFVRFQDNSSGQEQNEYHIEGLMLGVFGLFLGLIPAWLIGRNTFEGHHDGRFSIPALAGVSILIVSLLFYLISERKKLLLVCSILIAFAIGNQIHMNNEFRWDWERQTRAYWQLHWRAPEIEPKTAILVNKSLSFYTTTYPVAYALNIMYAYDDLNMTPDYWWFEIYASDLYKQTNELVQGGWITPDKGHLQVSMKGDNSLVFFLPSAKEPTKCLWLITEQDKSNPQIPKELLSMSPLTNLSRIHQNPEKTLPTNIFGEEPAFSWCYYYQKAQLAAQFQEWESVVELFEAAQKEGKRSIYGYEYFLFIKGFIEINDWSQAVKLTLGAQKLSPRTQPELCAIWQGYRQDGLEQKDDFMSSYLEVQKNLGCANDG